MRGSSVLAVVACLLLGSGCVELSKTEQAQWQQLFDDDVVDEPIKHKNVWIATPMNFLIPGTGHFYLGESGSGGALLISNLLWPLSVTWGTYAGIKDTPQVNKRYTVDYYQFGPGATVLADLQASRARAAAEDYLALQLRSGRIIVSQAEVREYLFVRDFDSEHVMKLEWQEIEVATGVTLPETKAQATQLEALQVTAESVEVTEEEAPTLEAPVDEAPEAPVRQAPPQDVQIQEVQIQEIQAQEPPESEEQVQEVEASAPAPGGAEPMRENPE